MASNGNTDLYAKYIKLAADMKIEVGERPAWVEQRVQGDKQEKKEQEEKERQERKEKEEKERQERQEERERQREEREHAALEAQKQRDHELQIAQLQAQPVQPAAPVPVLPPPPRERPPPSSPCPEGCSTAAFRDWLHNFEIASASIDATEKEKIRWLHTLLPVEYRNLFQHLSPDQQKSYTELKAALRTATDLPPSHLRNRFFTATPTQLENAGPFVQRARHHLDDWLQVAKVTDENLRDFLVWDLVSQDLPLSALNHIENAEVAETEFNLRRKAGHLDAWMARTQAGRSLAAVMHPHKKRRQDQQKDKQGDKGKDSGTNGKNNHGNNGSNNRNNYNNNNNNNSHNNSNNNRGNNNNFSGRSNNNNRGGQESHGGNQTGGPPPRQQPGNSRGHQTQVLPSTSQQSTSRPGQPPFRGDASGQPGQRPQYQRPYPPTVRAQAAIAEPVAPEGDYDYVPDQDYYPMEQANFAQVLDKDAIKWLGGFEHPQYPGHVNGQEISLVLDTGTTAIFVDRKLVRPEDFEDTFVQYRPPEGPPLLRQRCTVDINCKFYVGKAQAVALCDPAVPVLLGWVPHLGPAFKKHEYMAELARWKSASGSATQDSCRSAPPAAAAFPQSSPCRQDTRTVTPVQDHEPNQGLNSRPPESACLLRPRKALASTPTAVVPKEYATLRKNNARLQEESSFPRSDASMTIGHYSRLQPSVNEDTAEKEKLHRLCHKQSRDLFQLTTEHAKLKELYRQLTAENSALESQVATISAQCTALHLLAEKDEAEKKKMQRWYDDLGDTLSQRTADLTALQDCHKQLTLDHAEVKENYKDLRQQQEKLQERQDQVSAEKASLLRLNEDLKNELTQRPANPSLFAALREEYSKVQDDLRSVVLDNEELRADCKAVQAENIVIREKMTETEEKLEATRTQVTTLADEVSKLVRKSNSSQEEHPPSSGPSRDVPPTAGNKPRRHFKPRKKRLPLLQHGLCVTKHLVEQVYDIMGADGRLYRVPLRHTNLRTVENFFFPAFVRSPPPWTNFHGRPPLFPYY